MVIYNKRELKKARGLCIGLSFLSINVSFNGRALREAPKYLRLRLQHFFVESNLYFWTNTLAPHYMIFDRNKLIK
jgi:hypothetical protein